MNKMNKIIENLKQKYSSSENTSDFSRELNNKINAFYTEQSNVDSFFHWLKNTNEKLDLNLQHMVSTFFPSLSFSITYEIDKYKKYSIYKEEVFCISFIEECYTSVFNSYIRENKDGDILIYHPSDTPIRDSEFDSIYNKIINEIEIKYPNKVFLKYRYLNYVLGNLNLTYSSNPKTRLFEVLFREKIL